ncbi:hypothetical protein C7212DRAFT_345398 [Tuber magnatum]|uniref:Uncharacterized protein n=1 Tax=Tuber magnatum TaxID=42249 RepID=A0A317SLS4_9PEZI|nr:hypothetical protein C7212DRAFT_345398 [Tuber magnatum]
MARHEKQVMIGIFVLRMAGPSTTNGLTQHPFTIYCPHFPRAPLILPNHTWLKGSPSTPPFPSIFTDIHHPHQASLSTSKRNSYHPSNSSFSIPKHHPPSPNNQRYTNINTTAMSFGDTRITNLIEGKVETFHPLLVVETGYLNFMAHDINAFPMARDKLNKENKTTPTVTIATPVGDRIPATQAAEYTFQQHMEIDAISAPTPITSGKLPTSENFKTTPTKTPRWSNHILELAQDKVTINSTAHGWWPTKETATNKEAPVTQLASDINVKSASKVKSRILDPRGRVGVTNNSVNQRLKARSAVKARSKDRVAKRVEDIRANHVNQIENKNQNMTTTKRVPKTKRKVTPRELINGTEQHTRIVRWLELCAQAQPFLLPTAPKTPPRSPTVLANKSAATPTAPNTAKSTTKPKSAVLKPKAGAGITKQTPNGRPADKVALKSKAKGKPAVGEGRDATSRVTENTNLSNLRRSQIPSQAAPKPVSPILKPKGDAGVTKQTSKPCLNGQNTENTTTSLKFGTTKAKGRAGGKKKTAAQRIWEETAILMAQLEWLKSVDAELSDRIAAFRSIMKSEDTIIVRSSSDTSSKYPIQEPKAGAGLSQGQSAAMSMGVPIEFMDTTEEWGIEGGTRQTRKQG